ncbi:MULTISPECIES: cyclic nucleotide-binding domain-containing protein [unclassified Treponema]|uniref:cyclic nucleotide-binding domain-containing protein n=1 Tax=unclassified Treponema TaxID=2638727 RepID=UPI00053014CD|nr:MULTISPECIES: cyclic nucleotide-binding domain-containing protein [unclassified Treponema]AIW89496.1 catabolite gene activator protein [Treponema sp. OMZ 838]UTC50466.1 cyclic nucleotide-binding domain-containing protein [Treponema sp. OMZ 855]
MPKAVQYSANSVIYFSGDFDARVFLLHSGHIALNSLDIETGAQVTEYIKTGEFFGVKSALGNYPREESAMVLTDSLVYTFSVAEFESFAQTNTRIILQMLKVFSRQLRNIHHQLESLMDSKQQTNNEDGLFTVATAFYKSQHYQAAAQVAARYRALYPSGKHLAAIGPIIANSTQMAGRSFGEARQAGSVNAVPGGGGAAAAQPEQNNDASIELTFQLAEDLAKQQKWADAYKQYHTIIELKQGANVEASYLGAARCLYKQAEYVRCIQLGTGFITQFPKSLKLAEILMFLGLCYQGMDRPDKALPFYDKALTMAGPLLVPKIKELQATCEGAIHA